MDIKVKHEGWVLINGNDFILEWSFRFYRKDAIKAMVDDSLHTWKYWRKEGMRCVKATKTISVLVNKQS